MMNACNGGNTYQLGRCTEGGGDSCTCEDVTYATSQETAQTGHLFQLTRDTPLALAVGSVATVTGWASSIQAGGATANVGTGVITCLDRGLIDVTLDLNVSYTGIEEQVVEVKLFDADVNEIADGIFVIGESDTPAVVQYGGDTGLGAPRLLALSGESNAATFGGVPNSYSGYTFPENGVLTWLEVWRDNTAASVTFNVVDGAGVVISGPHVLGIGVATLGFAMNQAVLAGSVAGVEYTATGGANPGLVTSQISWKKSHTRRESWSLSGTLEVNGVAQTVRVDAGVVTGAGPVSVTSASFKAVERQPPLNTETKSVCVCPVECLEPSSAEIIDSIGGTTPIVLGGPGGVFPVAGETWTLRVYMPTDFNPPDYTPTILYNGAPHPPGFGPIFASVSATTGGPGPWYWELDFTAPPNGDTVGLTIATTAEPACTWTQQAGTTVEA